MSDHALPAWAQALDDGLYAVDTAFQRDRFDAAYLIVGDGRAAFVDTGTNHAVPRLLALLDHLGLPRDAVEAVVPTHVHLDHAGGAGRLMRELPSATLWVHPRGAPHLIDPSKLYAGALAVYGQTEMDRSYGELVPVPAERVRVTADDEWATLAGRRLRFIDAPGHARHHHAIWDERTRGWFTGDCFGLSYREFDTQAGGWLFPTSTPVQFDPPAMRATVQRLLRAEPRWLYLTHFSRVAVTPLLVQVFFEVLDATVVLARSVAALPAAERHERLKAGLLEIYEASLRRHGVTMPSAAIADLLAVDLELNAQGVGIWLDREDRP